MAEGKKKHQVCKTAKAVVADKKGTICDREGIFNTQVQNSIHLSLDLPYTTKLHTGKNLVVGQVISVCDIETAKQRYSPKNSESTRNCAFEQHL